MMRSATAAAALISVLNIPVAVALFFGIPAAVAAACAMGVLTVVGVHAAIHFFAPPIGSISAHLDDATLEKIARAAEKIEEEERKK